MRKKRIATAWVDACSGCHMSFLDMDERLLDIAENIELVYGPLVDYKDIPEDVDVFLVSGSVSTDEELEKVREIRAKTQVLVAFGDCAVTGNLPSMRNLKGSLEALCHVYSAGDEVTETPPGIGEDSEVPRLLKRVRPVHEVVKVDQYIQGCPPEADLIHFIMSELLEGRLPRRGVRTHFG